MLAELRALRAAAGVGDDGEELPEVDEAAVAAEGTSTNANLTSRLIKANKAAEAAKRVAEDMEAFRKTAEERLARIEQLESEALADQKLEALPDSADIAIEPDEDPNAAPSREDFVLLPLVSKLLQAHQIGAQAAAQARGRWL